jgi:hypothetical protein
MDVTLISRSHRVLIEGDAPRPLPRCGGQCRVPTNHSVIAATRAWVDRVVIGLNLCPFAKAVQARGQVRYVLSAARDEAALQAELVDELLALVAADPSVTDTTLLIHPQVLADFFDYSRFLPRAARQLKALKLDGVLQIASFHPHYRFRDTDDEDIANCSNRSPHPTLHLLRESSIDAAVTAFPDACEIYERNIETLRRLGLDGWRRLMAAACMGRDADEDPAPR